MQQYWNMVFAAVSYSPCAFSNHSEVVSPVSPTNASAFATVVVVSVVETVSESNVVCVLVDLLADSVSASDGSDSVTASAVSASDGSVVLSATTICSGISELGSEMASQPDKLTSRPAANNTR